MCPVGQATLPWMWPAVIMWLGLVGFPVLSIAGDQPYLKALVQRARELHLAERSEWRVLLHYKPWLIAPGVKSLVDAQSFFNAPAGKIDPDAELVATLTSFFASADEKDPDQHPQCHFMARYAWLRQALHFDRDRLPEQRCPRFERWFSTLNPQQLTLIFASAYLNNPASMFGHTLLRIDARGQVAGTELLAYTVNFVADTHQGRGLGFAVKGIFGGYPGRFSVAPYYRKVKEYGDIENRDLWEYRLNFTPEEVEHLLEHLWELRSAYFDYFFFDENCSYQLLSLLEVARPSLNLTDRFQWWTVPADTIRAVTEVAGLLEGVRFRSASSTILGQRLQRMTGDRVRLAQQLATAQITPEADAVKKLSPVEQAQVLELAVEYRAYRVASKPQPQAQTNRLSLALLKARNQLDVPGQIPVISTPKVRPDQGHGSARVGVGYGYEEPESFAQIGLRLGYHDLMDPEGGYTRGAQVQFFNVGIRFYPEDQKFALDHLDAIDIVSLSPWNRLMKPVSWKVNVGATQRLFEDNKRSLVGRLNPGVGLSYELARNALVYAFAESSLEVSDRFDPFFAVSVGPTVGILHDLSDRWRVGLAARLQHFFLSSAHTDQGMTLSQRLSLSNQSALRFDVAWRHESGHSFIGGNAFLLFYF
jgi:uncharacterized protein DUF4105